MKQPAWCLGWLGALLGAGCSPPPPVTGSASTPGVGTAAAAAVPESWAPASDVLPGDGSVSGPSGSCGMWVERDERLYRRTTFAFLTAEPEHPGRVVVRAFLSDRYECGPCPRGTHCEPCGDRNVLRPFRGAADAAAFIAFGSQPAGRCVDAYLSLGPGYLRYAGTQVGSDPREQTVWLETTTPLDDSLCTAEPAEAGEDAAGTVETCLAEFVPGAMVERAEEPVARPTPRMLDIAERLRRAELSFAAGRWDEARTGYHRVQREAGMDDLATWSYAEWRKAVCGLRLNQPLPAVEGLTSLLGLRVPTEQTVRGLRQAAVADLGRAYAALLDHAADVETSLVRSVEGEELLAALEAAEEAWAAAGRTTEARALQSIVLQRRSAATEDPAP